MESCTCLQITRFNDLIVVLAINQTIGNRTLISLTIAEVQLLFAHLHLRRCVSSVVAQEVNGRKLLNCKSLKELQELLEMTSVETHLMLDYIKIFQNHGVPLYLLSGATS